MRRHPSEESETVDLERWENEGGRIPSSSERGSHGRDPRDRPKNRENLRGISLCSVVPRADDRSPGIA